jgi:hypothetical protein
MDVRIEVDRKSVQDATNYLDTVPKRVERATNNALLQLGLRGAGTASESAPYLTGNLRRSIHVRGNDSFPYWKDTKNLSILPTPPPSASSIKGAVWFGTNLSYARKQNEKNRSKSGFMEKGLDKVESNAERVFAFFLDSEGVK